MKKADKVFKWIILGIFVAHIMIYFMPIYKYTYKSTYSDPETTLVYLYGSSSSYSIISFTSLLIPIAALVFLFAQFKNSKLFFFGFSATYIINCIFTILLLSKAILNNNSNSYQYSFQYGYYVYIATLGLLAVAIIVAFIIYLVQKSKDKREEPTNLHQDLKIDILRKRIELLDDLKNQGVLTESEYAEKRADIIKDLKI